MRYVAEDCAYGHLVTRELQQASPASKYAVVRLFECASGKVLLKGLYVPEATPAALA